MSAKDRAEILRILEDNGSLVDAIFEAAEWCYREKKEFHDTEAFIEALKDAWDDVHSAKELA